MQSNYEKLEVFKRSHTLVLEVMKELKRFPREQKYLLYDQLFRSISSIPANIAEGFGRNTKKEKVRFLYICRGSAEESKYHLLLAKDLGFITEKVYSELYAELTEIIRMLSGLIKTLKRDS